MIRLPLPERTFPAVPLADAGRLWRLSRRTTIMRALLAVGALALLVALLAGSLALRTRPTSYFARGGGGIAVVDFSKSIDPRAYRRTAQILRALADSDQRLGLVAFSDDAYEMLPPGTRGDEVRPMLRFFETRGGALSLAGRTTPWTTAFLGGTNVGEGLRAARLAFERTKTRHGSVLLVSDLDDSSTDVPLLTEEIGRYRDAGIKLRVAPLFPTPENLAFFTGLAGRDAVLGSRELLDNSKVAEHQSVVGAFPTWLFLGGLALLLAIAANERLTRRLEWKRA